MATFDEFDWSKFGNTAAQSAAAALPAAVIGYMGHRQVAKGNQQAANIAADTARTNIAEIRTANANAARTLQPIAARATPALDYFQSVMARNPYDFTPGQQIELEDRRRIATNSVSPGLRGSARTNTAVINDVLNRARAGMIDTNQRRADSAAGTLGTAGVNATTNAASIASGQGPQVASQNLQAGQAAGNAITGTAASGADTMGNIASYFANAMKDRERESRYQRYKEGAV
jgi:hypothetical protein